jgi:hypothetical protein
MGTNQLQNLNEGRFILKNEDVLQQTLEYYLKFIEFCKKYHLTPYKTFFTGNFCWAFRVIVTHPKYDNERFYLKLEERKYELKPQMTKYAYLDTLAGIYNFRCTKNILKFS